MRQPARRGVALKRVGITQRVVTAANGERRDALDQRWLPFLHRCGLQALALPNDTALALAVCRDLGLSGVVFSGGNDLAALGGDAPERDATERALLDLRLPVLGVCRGMQFLVHAAGGRLEQVSGHAGTRHTVTRPGGDQREVNSFHQFAVCALGSGQTASARSADGCIEAFEDPARTMAGVLWHPEREAQPHPDDVALIRRLFSV